MILSWEIISKDALLNDYCICHYKHPEQEYVVPGKRLQRKLQGQLLLKGELKYTGFVSRESWDMWVNLCHESGGYEYWREQDEWWSGGCMVFTYRVERPVLTSTVSLELNEIQMW